MRKVLIYSGTTEGRELAEHLSAAGIECTVSVATEYGELVMPELPGVWVHQGRMSEEEMEAFMKSSNYAAVVDATHPFATEVSENIRAAAQKVCLSYLRLKRDTASSDYGIGEKKYFSDAAQCAVALESMPGNILLTTGSKELDVFCREDDVKERLFVRVLPGVESIRLCEEQGIAGKHILAMQGPFSEELNHALIRQFDIKCLVTKESGSAGGYTEKLEAAKRAGIPVYVIANPEKQSSGFTLKNVLRRLEELLDCKILTASGPVKDKERKIKIALIGIGMGSPDTLTVAAKNEIAQADIVFGAKRMLSLAGKSAEKYPYYLAEDILPCLRNLPEGPHRVAILFSGDTGFYSGCSKMKEKLDAADIGEVTVYPGISSISYLAARTGISWQDAKIMSIHGRGEEKEWRASVVDAIRYHQKTFLLMSGAQNVQRIGHILTESGLEDCTLWVGYELSYPEERILKLMPDECGSITEEGLYTCLVCNPAKQKRAVTHGWRDEEFVRDKVPMTKEEIREISISKLHLREDAVVYDIGSGTGSIAMEIAARSSSIQVYAIEKKPQAVELIEENRKKFGLDNVQVLEAEAPEGIVDLEAPTHAFIGGSSGNLKDILMILYRKNPKTRIVINAISMETIGEISDLLKEGWVNDPEVVWVQANRSKAIGSYHLMQAENPVMIASFTLERKEA